MNHGLLRLHGFIGETENTACLILQERRLAWCYRDEVIQKQKREMNKQVTDKCKISASYLKL